MNEPAVSSSRPNPLGEKIRRDVEEFKANGGVIENCDIERRDGSLGSWKERSEAGKINNDNYARVNARRKR